MPYCPNCGGHVGWGEDSCSMCGESLDDASADGPEPDRDRDRTAESDPDRRPRSDRRESRPSGRERGGRGPPARRHEEDAEDRRTAVKYGLGVLGLMVVGVFGLEFVQEDSPTDAVDAWRTAWADGDTAAYDDRWHSESPARDGTSGDRFRPEPDSDLRYISEERSVLSQTDGKAGVRDVFLLDHPDFDVRRRVTDTVDLRTESGDWAIWDYRTEAVEQVTDCDRSFTITGGTRIECE